MKILWNIAMNYMLHNMIVFRILILFPIADPLVVTVVRKSDVNFMINEIISNTYTCAWI